MSHIPYPQAHIDVVVVSDYEGSSNKTWSDERSILQALADQQIPQSFNVILVEDKKSEHSVPPDLYGIFPRLKIIFTNEHQSARLKDEGVKHAQAEYTAVLEADCLPDPHWLCGLYKTLMHNKEFAAASGRTTYGHETMYQRCLSLLDRSFDNLGAPGKTAHISNNGALYRTEVLKQFPYPDSITPFLSSRMRAKAMSAHGHQFYFQPDAVMRHAIGGFGFVCDFRRNTGYADMMEQGKPCWSSIPAVMSTRFSTECSDCIRLGPKYLKWYDWPLLSCLLISVPFLGIPGMMDAIHARNSIPASSYR